MPSAERKISLKKRLVRSGLILLGGAAISTGLIAGCSSEQDKANEIHAEASELRNDLGQYVGIYFQREPDPNDPRVARIEELSRQATPHENRIEWLAPTAMATVITTGFGTMLSLMPRPEV